MDMNFVYVISCSLSDEKKLAKAIEVAFERKLSLSKNASLLEGHKPQILDHIWFNLRKADGLYIELRHNRDIEGRLELPDHADYPLILFTRINETYATANGADPIEVRDYVFSCVKNLPYNAVLVGNAE